MRQALIREMLQWLGLKNVKLKDNHAIIKGYYAEYSLHLGSGNIHRLPGGSLAIIPVHAQHRGRIFLPFADDDPKTAEVVSKVLLLARDEEIMDPMILDQLGASADLRLAKSLEMPAPAPASSGAAGKAGTGKSKASGATLSSAVGSPLPSVTTGRRRFEFSDGKSNKFWEIEINGSQVTTTWGRIGSTGQTKTKDYSTGDKAQAEYDKLVSEKTTKGYVEA
jgi:predicted DNA-binding WGR domain protein